MSCGWYGRLNELLNNNNFTSYMSDNEAGRWFLNESKALNKTYDFMKSIGIDEVV